MKRALRPRKRFGQNFLDDAAVIAQLLTCLRPRQGDCFIEIGPGRGALTAPLIAQLGTLTAVEIDRDLATRLRARFGAALKLIEADALTVDFAALARKISADRPVRLVGNLPYNISTPLLFHLLESEMPLIDAHFMLQKEVVARMAAAPGSRDYGRLSVMLACRYEVVPLLTVPAEAFFPAPKVESAFVRLLPKPASALPNVDKACLRALVRDAFAQRRKMLRNTLQAWFSGDELAALGVAPDARAEMLSLDDFVRLSRYAATRQKRVAASVE